MCCTRLGNFWPQDPSWVFWKGRAGRPGQALRCAVSPHRQHRELGAADSVLTRSPGSTVRGGPWRWAAAPTMSLLRMACGRVGDETQPWCYATCCPPRTCGWGQEALRVDARTLSGQAGDEAGQQGPVHSKPPREQAVKCSLEWTAPATGQRREPQTTQVHVSAGGPIKRCGLGSGDPGEARTAKRQEYQE